MYNFDPYNVLLAIATNIPVLLMTGPEAMSAAINVKNTHIKNVKLKKMIHSSERLSNA